jgi:hypothetical protein
MDLFSTETYPRINQGVSLNTHFHPIPPSKILSLSVDPGRICAFVVRKNIPGDSSRSNFNGDPLPKVNEWKPTGSEFLLIDTSMYLDFLPVFLYDGNH